MRIPHLFTALVMVLALAPARSAEKTPGFVSGVLEKALGAEGDPRARAGDVWRDIVVAEGAIQPALDALKKLRTDGDASPEAVRDILRLEARLLRRRGDTSMALDTLTGIAAADETAADVRAKAEILDALGRNADALTAYRRMFEFTLPPELENRVLLRMALLEEKKEKEGPTPLAAFARAEGRDPLLKNQAAVVLALIDQQKDAIDLFTPYGEGSKRFRQLVRLADWAIEAEAFKRAQEFAWEAVETAKLRRDRRYALTILVEAYRRDNALDALLERFAATEDLEDEARRVWIDLLRETGKVETALALFKESVDGKFTPEMRREMLEMCRETGREDILVAAYRDLIRTEPRRLEWRRGLSSYFLENGNREEALAVWRAYPDVTDDARYLMAAAATLMDLGLDGLAIDFARGVMKADENERPGSLLFLFELHLSRGRMDAAEAALTELGQTATADAAVRVDLADAWSRIGDRKRAVDILTALRAARGGRSGPDAAMRLALLLSEIGEEEKALGLWKELWTTIDSVPRRRYVEERMMTVAARLGTLATIAIDLEQKLADGKATDRDAGLLVRLYTRVNDPVSATEIIEEHMTSSGRKPVDVLAEKARVFLSCTDYYNYEETIQELLVIDPEGAPDYLRQLAMSKLERGKQGEAREVLIRLKEVEGDSASDEFEAGVFALAGMRHEALASYRRGIARYPDRIDTYLLLSNVQKELGRHDRSAGMFQYLVQTAESDDLFTIAIDGILNMRDGRGNRGAPDRLVEWARRLVLERLSTRPDKLYLYQLVADLSEEVRDKDMAVRALKAALPIAGEQRTSLLRELMAMTAGDPRNTSYIFVGGVPQRADVEIEPDHLMFGRRLLGQGEMVPPQVYLDLGSAFLAAGEVTNATKTFEAASRLPEFAELRRKIASAFESARYPREALRAYQQILTVETSDLSLITKVAELNEQLGRDDLARELYRRGIDLYLSRQIVTKTATKKKEEKDDQPWYWRPRNVDADDAEYEWLVLGFAATGPRGRAFDEWLGGQRDGIDGDLERARADEAPKKALESFPRLAIRSALYRRLAAASGRIELADALDRRLLNAFPDDRGLLEELARYRLDRGFVLSARSLVATSNRDEKERARLRLLVGGMKEDDLPASVSLGAAASLFLPMLVEGRLDAARTLLERLDLSSGTKEDLTHLPLLTSAAAYLDHDIGLALCRHWLNTLVRTSTAGSLYSHVEAVLRQSRLVLKESQRRSLYEHLVTRIVENPDRFSIFISRLPDLAKSIGEDLLTTEQVQTLIRKRLDASDRMVYGIPALFGLLPAEECPSTLRSVWAKVPKTQRTAFLIQMVPVLRAKADESFTEFIVSSFTAALADVPDPRMLGWSADSLVQGAGDNLPVVIRMVEAIITKLPENPQIQIAHAMALKQGKQPEEAWQVARAALAKMIGGSNPEPNTRWQMERLIREFGDDHRDELIALVTEVEKKTGGSVELTNLSVSLAMQGKDQDAYLATLRDAAKKYPDEINFWRRLRHPLAVRGRWREMAEVQEKIIELEPAGRKERARQTLVSDWLRLKNPVRALAVLTDAERAKKEKAAKAPRENRKKARTPVASIAAVKEALGAGKADEARLLYRRVWRVFPDRSNQYYRFSYDSRSRMRQIWPRDRAAATDRPPSRGGLDGFLVSLERDPPPPPEPVAAAEVLVAEDFGRDEIARQLRSLSPSSLDGFGAGDLYQALANRYASQEERSAAIEGLLAMERTGRAGKREYGLLFALLEGTEEPSVELSATLAGLLENLNAGDTAGLRRLARLYARIGSGRRASTLYRWAAAVPPSENRSFGFGMDLPTHELLREVIRNLEGEDRDAAVTAILEFSAPDARYAWGRDGYERMVFETWEEIMGPLAAFVKTRELVEGMEELGEIPRRNAAKAAAYLAARSDHHELALRCLEIGVCKLEPPTEGRSWYRTMFTNPGRLGTVEMRRLFPRPDGWWNSVPWMKAVAKKYLEWLDAERLNEDGAFRTICVLAVRLAEAGEKETATRLADRIGRMATDDPGRRLWYADLLRHRGDAERADAIELELLRENLLYLQRVTEVLARVAAGEGAAAALKLGEVTAEITLHPDLTAKLAELATATGDAARAAHWKQVAEEAAAAEKELEERKKKGR